MCFQRREAGPVPRVLRGFVAVVDCDPGPRLVRKRDGHSVMRMTARVEKFTFGRYESHFGKEIVSSAHGSRPGRVRAPRAGGLGSQLCRRPLRVRIYTRASNFSSVSSRSASRTGLSHLIRAMRGNRIATPDL